MRGPGRGDLAPPRPGSQRESAGGGPGLPRPLVSATPDLLTGRAASSPVSEVTGSCGTMRI